MFKCPRCGSYRSKGIRGNTNDLRLCKHCKLLYAGYKPVRLVTVVKKLIANLKYLSWHRRLAAAQLTNGGVQWR